MPSIKMLWIFLLVCFHPGYLESSRILALFPIPSPSHYFFVLPYLKSLASMGHEIFSVNPYPLKEPVKNIYDVPVPEVFEKFDEFVKRVLTSKNTWQSNDVFNEYSLNLTDTVLNNEGVRREILSPKSAPFDLIIADLWRIDALCGLAAHLEAPIIGVAPYGTDWKIDELVGNSSPNSYLQSPYSHFHDLETYRGRLAQFVEQSISWINYKWRHVEKLKALQKKYFPNIAKIPRNFALVLVNQHFTLGPPRPYVPNMIEVGGLHVDQNPKPLPKELEDFIQGAGDAGVIYFSLGTNVKSKSLSEDRRNVLLNTFANLPQRVLWKFDDEQLPGTSANVFISKWFPQQDILAHPQVKLFITHGGLLSTIESIHHAKPMLGMPCLFDQFRNMEHVQRLGLGLTLNLQEMTAEEFNSTIVRLLTEKSFDVIAKTTAARYRDKPMGPMETAIWWTHYVLRHKGAAHMSVAGKELDFFIYHSLDVLGTFLLAFLVTLGILSICIFKTLKRFKLKAQLKSEKNKQKKKVH